jgi:hypothetical protein
MLVLLPLPGIDRPVVGSQHRVGGMFGRGTLDRVCGSFW